MTSSTSWQQSGKERHTRGEAEYGAAQMQGYAEGTLDRLQGKMDMIVGDKDLQAQADNRRLDEGITRQDAKKPT